MLNVRREGAARSTPMKPEDIIYKDVDDTYCSSWAGGTEIDDLSEKVRQLTRIVAALVQVLGDDVAKEVIKKSSRDWQVVENE